VAIIAEDNFTRANTSTGWGTSTNGAGVTNYAWANDGTGLAGVKIVSNKGQISDSASRYCHLDDGNTHQTQEIVVECSIDNTADTFGALACWHGTSGAGTDWYLARYDGAGHIVIMSRKSSSNVTQATANFTITTGHVYRIRFNIVLNGSNQPVLSARIWDTSGSEPGTWTISWTDTGTAIPAGRSGVYGFADSSLSHKASYTFYSLDDLQAASRTIGTVTAALQTSPTRTISSATAALQTSPTRTISSVDTALSTSGVTRTITPSTAALQTTLTRTISSIDSALQTTTTRTITSVTLALQTSPTRTITADSALATSGNTRTISGIDAAITGQGIRTMTSIDVALSTSGVTRTVTASAALQVTTRLVPGTAALSQAGITRTVNTVTAALSLAGILRTVSSVSAALQTSPTRTIAPATAALSTSGVTRTISSVTLALSVAGLTRTLGSISGALLMTLSRTISGMDAALQTSPTRTIAIITASLGTTVAKTSGATQFGVGTGPATMQADGSKTVSWTSPSSGSDTEKQLTSANASGDGWALGENSTYGGMPFSSLYEKTAGAIVNSSMNSVNSGSQITMATSVPDGHLHVLCNASHGFIGTEDITNFTVNEQAPVQTGLRRYISVSGTDANTITWTITACIYPGDPGFIFWKINLANNSGSGISTVTAGSTDNLEICSPAGMLSNSGSGSNQGPWKNDATHAFYGTVSTLAITGPVPDGSSSNTPGEPDLFGLIPLAGMAGRTDQRLGLVVTKFTKWADNGLSGASFASLSNTSRIKLKWGAAIGTIANGTSWDFYLMEALRCNLSTADMLAIAADYLQPGAPQVVTGTLTTFNYPNHPAFPFNLDEGCYVLSATNNAINTTLDLSAVVQPNVRYKPRFKITGLSGLTQTDGSELKVSWGGMALNSGTDYNIYVDTTHQIAYLHLQFDVVASGAGTGQKNNAALAVGTPITRTISSVTAALTFTATRTVPVSVALQTSPLRTLTPNSAALLVTSIRTLTPVAAALQTSPVRTLTPVAAAFTTSPTRTISSVSTALASLGLQRVLASISAALLMTPTRTLPSASALQTSPIRPLAVSAALSQASIIRTLSTITAALSGGTIRAIPADTALSEADIARLIASVTAALTLTQVRSIPPSAALATSPVRTVAATASLSGVSLHGAPGRTTFVATPGATTIFLPNVPTGTEVIV